VELGELRDLLGAHVQRQDDQRARDRPHGQRLQHRHQRDERTHEQPGTIPGPHQRDSQASRLVGLRSLIIHIWISEKCEKFTSTRLGADVLPVRTCFIATDRLLSHNARVSYISFWHIFFRVPSIKVTDQFIVSVRIFGFTGLCRRDCLSHHDRSCAQMLTLDARACRTRELSWLASGSNMTAKGKSPAIVANAPASKRIACYSPPTTCKLYSALCRCFHQLFTASVSAMPSMKGREGSGLMGY
jgi:hypothetical protein